MKSYALSEYLTLSCTAILFLVGNSISDGLHIDTSLERIFFPESNIRLFLLDFALISAPIGLVFFSFLHWILLLVILVPKGFTRTNQQQTEKYTQLHSFLFLLTNLFRSIKFKTNQLTTTT